MYAILDDADVIIGFETRVTPLENLVHPDFIGHYVLTKDEKLKVGDGYDRETGTFTITPEPEPEPQPQPQPQEPSLSEAEQTQLELDLNVEYLTCLMELND
ncbi:MAG: hypothetical protein PHX08_12390 [Lachnospiraceae bacterium]|nr:hypothetical protein [Lachnospiraceae bacterium]